jgi:hypothetical protein
MYNPHCILITSFAHEIFWRLINREESKANEKFNHGNSSHSNDEVTPPHIVFPVTDGILLAGEISQDRPSDQSSHNLGDCPIN